VAYLFLFPGLAFIAVVYVYPILRLIPMSLQRIAIGKYTWVGFNNFRYLLFEDQIVRQAVSNNIRLLVGIPIIIVLALLLAALLFEKVSGVGFYQAIILLPYILSIPVAGLVMRVMLRSDGAINQAFQSIGLPGLTQNWLGSADLAIWSLLAVIVWRELGMGVALFLAELLTMDEEILDAGKVDGASWFQRLRYLIVPHLRTMIGFYTIYLVIVFFSWTFSYVFVMTNGGPGFSTTVIEFSIYRYAVDKHMPHMAAALSLLLFLSMFVLIWIQFRIRRGLIEET
jgi:raffinose/stachyose/melibiose transport system permease protein